MLSVAQDIVNQLTPYQNALNIALEAMTSLPLVGEELSELQEWNTVFQDSFDNLASRVDSLPNGHFELSIPLGSFQETFTFDLGLDAFLQVHTSGGVSATINPALNVAFDLTNGVPSLDPTNTGLDIGFVISLPDFELTASLHNYLFAKAVDEGTTFSGNLGFRFTSGLGIEAEFSGDAHVRLGLAVSLVDPALGASFNPRFFTDLELDWGFDTNGDLEAPVIAFRDFSLDADSFMQGFLGDTVRGVQKFTLPMQKFIDMFEQPVPIVSSFDSDETMGDLFLKAAGMSQEQQDRFNTMVKIVNAVNKFDFSGTTGGAVINFGDILLTGDARQAGQFIFNTDQLQGVIDDIMNSPELQAVQEKLETVAEYIGFTADAGFKYPLLENPGPVIGSLLTGQPEIMFSYSTGRQHFELGVSAGVGIPDLLGFFINAGIVFDANLSVGYDTAGLIKFLQNGQASDLLHGFYIDNGIDTSGPPIPNVPNPRKTSLYLQGHADISASAGVTVSGGLYADISFELATNSTSTRVYLDDIITNLQNNVKVFNPSGRLYAAANLEFTVPTGGVGPSITLFEHRLAYFEVVSFNLPPAPTPELPLTVIDVTGQHTLLLDVTKMTGNGVVKVQPFHDYPIAEDGGYLGDGIRVDYPSEIVMYVERKNDITTNYYNFIGLNGAVPDGVSIDIVDPFNVFDTESAPDPQPAQTEPGVLLAGGKDVIYRYTDKPGGGLATVLLAGGYGSNNLSGATMAFGNFVPADRSNQAKSHFGNVTGFDAAGQAYVNARIDSVLAPANPAGIIGATMTGSRGGLMLGGPGNNSFIALGPGEYEMVGGTWTNNFTISPSFNGVPATYEIDGGPFGKSVLVVRVPTGENVSLENSAIVDKYNPTLKALAVTAKAGLSATAHGLRKVSIVAAPGADIELGDTSELNIEFTMAGASDFSFGGSIAPDTLTLSSDYSFYGREDLRYVRQLVLNRVTNTLVELPPGNWGGNIPENIPPYPVDRLNGPIYTLTRTFGTNGKTEEVKFRINNPFASAIKLNGRGGSDTYNITQGLGSFLDIEVRDSDTSTRNTVNVDFRHQLLLPHQATLTNNVLRLNYFTPMTLFNTYWWNNLFFDYFPHVYFYSTSAAYSPAVFFSANVDITLRTGRPFQETIVDRTNPPIGQRATILFDGVLDEYEAPGVLGWEADYMGSPSDRGWLWYQLRGDFWRTYFKPTIITQAYDTLNPEAGIIPINAQFIQNNTADHWSYYMSLVGNRDTGVNVIANAGDLTIDQSTIGLGTQNLDVRSNTGTITFKKNDASINAYNVHDNAGTINFQVARAWGPSSTRDVFTVLGNAGTINFNHTIPGTYRSDNFIVGIDHWIDVRGNTGVINVNTIVPRSLINYGMETYVKVGMGSLANVHGTINLANSNGHYGLEIDDRSNPGAGSPWTVERTKTQIGDLTINYPNINLPAPYADTFSQYVAYPKPSSTVTLMQDPPFYQKLFNGSASPAITLSTPFALANTTGDVVNLPITATGPAGAPLTFAASNLPPGLSINLSTGVISGTINLGSSAANPYETMVTVAAGQFRRVGRIFWHVASGITILLDQSELPHFEGESVSTVLSTNNVYNLPVTLTVTGLPPGLSFNASTRTISGTISPGAAQNSPYTVNIHATDGTETADYQLQWSITGITLNKPANQIGIVGESVSIAILGSTVSGAPLVYTAENLPDGLSINATTGVISGVLTAAAAATRYFYPTITVTNGNDSADTYFAWSVVWAGVSNYLSIQDPGLRNSREGDNGFMYLSADRNTLYLPITYTVTGLPPGLEHFDGDGNNYIQGTIAAGAASASPYQVEIFATDGIWSDTHTFDWIVRPSGTVSIQNNDEPWNSFVGQTFTDFQIYADHGPNETLAFSATGLPSGLSIDPTTGVISGTVLPVATSPSVFQASVTAATATDSDTWSFLWTVRSTYESHIVTLPDPSGTGTFDISSPFGTTLSASISPNAGVALPAGVDFPYDFLTFTIDGLQPGQAADLTISGLDPSIITDYYKYGATPNNPLAHWYNFLFGTPTDGDSAVGTGMEVVGNNIVLHLVDGGRGDDDVEENGVIFDIGAPATVSSSSQPPRVTDVFVSGSTWDSSVRNSLGGVGYDVPTDGRQLEPLAWGNLNQIAIRFDQNVVVSQSDLNVSGISAANYAFAAGGFSYDPATFVARWTLAAPIGGDRVTLQLADTVRDVANDNALDGEWTDGLGASASGNGAAGGAFQFRMNILPGDVNHDGQVNRGDLAAHITHQFTTLGGANYEIGHDLDGNSNTGLTDLAIFQRHLGRTLPPAQSPVANSPAAVVARVAGEIHLSRVIEPRLTARRVQLANKLGDGMAADLTSAAPRHPSSPLQHSEPVKARRLVRGAVDAALLFSCRSEVNENAPCARMKPPI